MLSKYALRQKTAASLVWLRPSRRWVQDDARNRLSNFWVPTQRVLDNDKQPESGHDLLVRAGYLRQAHSGIFHLLPLGLRVQDKVERLIDKHMQSIGASKVSLSSISSEELWQRSGRLDKGRASELLHLEDRKGAKYLLSPTHEEEITTIIANAVHSYKELPLRLYQVSRKYRDELRPRQGLLRGREFVMKDLYTFDSNAKKALETYHDVRRAYSAFMKELGLPHLLAKADSGNMGGSLSHEYHFASPDGEDTIIKCNSCEYSVNEELYVARYDPRQAPLPREINNSAESDVSSAVAIEHYVSKDGKTLCTIYYPGNDGEPNIYAVKAVFPDTDSALRGEQVRKQYVLSSADSPLDGSSDYQQISFKDPRLSLHTFNSTTDPELVEAIQNSPIPRHEDKVITFAKAQAGEQCPNCNSGTISLHQAVEIGHTFHLGQRYSKPLEANVLNENNKKVPIEMGCHGIGVSRLIGAVASILADDKGLNWPFAIAPFQVIIVPSTHATSSEVEAVYDRIVGNRLVPEFDVAIDDRERQLGWKLNDADLVGYPFIVVMGNMWRKKQMVELQCRRLGVIMDIAVHISASELVGTIREMSARLQGTV